MPECILIRSLLQFVSSQFKIKAQHYHIDVHTRVYFQYKPMMFMNFTEDPYIGLGFKDFRIIVAVDQQFTAGVKFPQ